MVQDQWAIMVLEHMVQEQMALDHKLRPESQKSLRSNFSFVWDTCRQKDHRPQIVKTEKSFFFFLKKLLRFDRPYSNLISWTLSKYCDWLSDWLIHWESILHKYIYFFLTLILFTLYKYFYSCFLFLHVHDPLNPKLTILWTCIITYTET